MTIVRISRALVALASLLFAAIALGIWAMPDQAARVLGLEATRTGGTAVMRADLGGLFAGLAMLCAAAVWTGRTSWSLAAAAVLGSIALGRALGWISTGGIGRDMPQMLIELSLIAALVAMSRSTTAAIERAPRRPRPFLN